MNVHQTIEAEALVDRTNFGQQRTAKGHQIALNGIHLGSGRLEKLAQIVSHQTIGTDQADQGIRQQRG